MGHSIHHEAFEVNKYTKEEIEGQLNEDAVYNSEGRGELPSAIQFFEDKVFEDIDEAYAEIDRLDNGHYHQLAVLFNQYEKKEPTKAILNLEGRISKLEDSLIEYIKKNSISNRKSKFVGCSECGSKINVKYVGGYSELQGHSKESILRHFMDIVNICPLCKNQLSSETVLTTFKQKIDKIKELKEELEVQKKNNNKKGKAILNWLVKTEYRV